MTWFAGEGVTAARSIERAIYKLLVSSETDSSAVAAVSTLSPLAAFFYVALFRAVRQLLRTFSPSNPTWVRRPNTPQNRIRPSGTKVLATFQRFVAEMRNAIVAEAPTSVPWTAGCSIEVADSHKLPVADASIDLVLTSPPYCTRIDYAISTSPELAVLGLDLESGLKDLRSRLIGTPTVRPTVTAPESACGPVCSEFLERVLNHESKAAKSYYYKTYAQYFRGIDRSVREIARCMRPTATCVIVVQDSYFKELKIDLPTIFRDIGRKYGLALGRRVDFPMSRTFANVNTKSRRYRPENSTTESVLCFSK